MGEIQIKQFLIFFLAIFAAIVAYAESTYPDLRDAHDLELQKAMDTALGPSHPEFWSGVQKKEFGIAVADVTDLHHPKAAWYNPNLMLYTDSAVVARDDLVCIVVYIDNHPDAGCGAVDGIKIVDDVMLEHAHRKR